MRSLEAGRRMEFAAQALIGALAAVLLFWGLGDRYLWQDEAQTAVLAQRMLRFGRPLAYDGVNLLSLDMHSLDSDAEFRRRTGDPRAQIDYFVQDGAFKRDTTWKWQPWGLFLLPAVSFKIFGATTLAARLPFALAGFATVFLLYRLARRWCGGARVAMLASLLLVLNPYWILHARQCRYYPLTSLFLVLALLAYARWQWGGRGGAAAFVAAAWCWFEVDYGSLWPVLAVLFGDAFLSRPRHFWKTVRVGAVLAALLAPFVYYYELWGRGGQSGKFQEHLRDNFFNTNEYVMPAALLLAALALWIARRRKLPAAERRILGVACGIVAAMLLWIPAVSEYAYLRYAIVMVPVAALLTAWTLVTALRSYAWLAAAILIVTPWMSLPGRMVSPADAEDFSPWVRTEWSYLYANLFGHRPDPNRIVIDWLRKNAAPTDEILTNYEDLPLIFYLPNPIRGGIAAFRAEDDAKTPPRFLILRRSADFVYWQAFEREQARYRWEQIPLQAPDVPWGNNPDPMGQQDTRKAPDLYIARRIGP